MKQHVSGRAMALSHGLDTSGKAKGGAPRGTSLYRKDQGATAHEAQAKERAVAMLQRRVEEGVHRATHSLVPTHAMGDDSRVQE